jgi:hypothetical protein
MRATASLPKPKSVDANGRAHYVMVEPDITDQTLDEGTAIVLVRKAGARFKCIRNPHPELL